ncbi:MAG: PspC domain-containing protein [Bacteroidales bacterium]|nr:PspC domain-containing protein [Bacteroidales bacterium]
MEKNKRLYRSAKSKVFGGVAGGIAEYFDIDPIIIRLLFVIIAFAGGGGAIVYLILWIALPLEPITPFTMNRGSGEPFNPGNPGEQSTTDFSTGTSGTSNPFEIPVKPENRNGLIGGIVLISLGMIFLANRFIPNINFHDLWPLALVVLGGVLIATSLAEQKNAKKE